MDKQEFHVVQRSHEKGKRRSPNHAKIEALTNQNAALQQQVADIKSMAVLGYVFTSALGMLAGAFAAWAIIH